MVGGLTVLGNHTLLLALYIFWKPNSYRRQSYLWNFLKHYCCSVNYWRGKINIRNVSSDITPKNRVMDFLDVFFWKTKKAYGLMFIKLKPTLQIICIIIIYWVKLSNGKNGGREGGGVVAILVLTHLIIILVSFLYQQCFQVTCELLTYKFM